MSGKQTLVVQLRPGVAALTGVVAALHGRAAEVEDLTYAVCDGVASIQLYVSMSEDQATLLARQLSRRIDVLDARVRSVA